MATEPQTLLLSRRRGALQALISLAGAATAASLVQASSVITPMLTPAPSPTAAAAAALLREPQRCLLQTSPVAGFQFHGGEEVWAAMRTGDILSLVREPHNRYDERAVRLEWNGEKVGYVPAVDNAAISQLMDRDVGLDAVITELRNSSNPWERISFAVYLTLP